MHKFYIFLVFFLCNPTVPIFRQNYVKTIFHRKHFFTFEFYFLSISPVPPLIRSSGLSCKENLLRKFQILFSLYLSVVSPLMRSLGKIYMKTITDRKIYFYKSFSVLYLSCGRNLIRYQVISMWKRPIIKKFLFSCFLVCFPWNLFDSIFKINFCENDLSKKITFLYFKCCFVCLSCFPVNWQDLGDTFMWKWSFN